MSCLCSLFCQYDYDQGTPTWVQGLPTHHTCLSLGPPLACLTLWAGNSSREGNGAAQGIRQQGSGQAGYPVDPTLPD